MDKYLNMCTHTYVCTLSAVQCKTEKKNLNGQSQFTGNIVFTPAQHE